MKLLNSLFIATLLTITCSFSQPGGPGYGHGQMREGPPPERLERFKKMRLIEVLKLNEEESIRFFAKQSAHEEIARDIMKERDKALDDLQELLTEENMKDVPKLVDVIETSDEKLFRERERFRDEVKKLLSPEKFAKFLLFERDFNKQVRGAMKDIYEGKRERWRGGRDDN
ncbi:MAG: hypothetical protein HY960_01145 [Ignavibacteriae bacterium]|nr:hypothetical protein [Ignavibacteriota bacterium]